MKKNKEKKRGCKLLFSLEMKKWAAIIANVAQAIGLKKMIKVTKRNRKLFCMRCAGTGIISYPASRGTKKITCQICQGTGYVLHEKKNNNPQK